MRFTAPLAGLAVIVLAGCAGIPASRPAPSRAPSPATAAPSVPGNAVIAWDHGPGGQDLRKIGRELRRFSAAAATGNLAAAGAACARLAATVTAAQTAPPVPASGHRWWTRALARFGTAAADCQAGTSGQDVALIAEAARQMHAGGADVQRATAALSAAGSG